MFCVHLCTYSLIITSQFLISKQLDLPPYICNAAGGVLNVFKSPVARTNKANPEQEELESLQAPVAALACFDSQQVTCLDEKRFPHIFIAHWDFKEDGWW